MGVRFVIGRAGMGKTHRCVEAIRSRLRMDAVDGAPLILLVPEQASLQMERAILGGGIVECRGQAFSSGTHRAEVLSFSRLGTRVMGSAAINARTPLSEPARTMILRHLFASLAPQFQYFRAGHERSRDRYRGGFFGELGRTIAELIQEAIEPAQLHQVATVCRDTTAEQKLRNPHQHVRLHDLALIYEAYLNHLGTDKLDPSQHLAEACARLPACRWIQGAQLWVDGFASLSGQEALTLVALAQVCSNVEITVLLDPAFVQSSAQRIHFSQEMDHLFRRPGRTWRSLQKRLIEAGVEMNEPILLEPACNPRFKQAETLARLERRLFSAGKRETTPDVSASSAVELCELPTRRQEVAYAVSKIREWVQSSPRPYRYRDIAIIMRDIELYHDLLTQSLMDHHIPFFVDRRRSVPHHAVIELLRSGLSLLTGGMTLETVRLLLKTGLLPITDDQADELENYLLAQGISGFETWNRADWTVLRGTSFGDGNTTRSDLEKGLLDRVNRSRRTIVGAVSDWLVFAAEPKSHDGPAWASALVRWLDSLDVSGSLERWSSEAEAVGDLHLADEHRQVWREIVALLEDVAFTFHDIPLDSQELTDLLEAALSEITMGLVPPTVDQVLIGGIERSRHPDIKAALLLGFNDDVFPARIGEKLLLNDDDRRLLRDNDLMMRPPSTELAQDERLLAYVSLTRASEQLVVTCAWADEEGRALRPSPYFDAIRRALPELSIQTLPDPIRARSTWDISSLHDLQTRLTLEMRSRRSVDDEVASTRCGGDGGLPLRSRWNALYESVRTEVAATSVGRWTRALSSSTTEMGRLSLSSIQRLYPDPWETSVSQLESYAACPFRHFSQSTLKLRERPQIEFRPVDVGQVHHTLLEGIVAELIQSGQSLRDVSESELSERIENKFLLLSSRMMQGGELSDARNRYILRRSKEGLARVLRAQRRAAIAGSGQLRAAELPFGYASPNSIPAIELRTPSGRVVFLRGFIDRVDLVEHGDELLGIVIDYKHTSGKQLDLTEVAHGLSLQLPAYLLALAGAGETFAGRKIRPIAAMYVGLKARYTLVDHPESKLALGANREGVPQGRGIVSFEGVNALEMSADSGWSHHYKVFRKKDGSLGNLDHSDVADPQEFQSFLDYTRTKLAVLCDQLLGGDVGVRPFRLRDKSPCSWCAMGSVCRFEMGLGDVRFLSSWKRSVALANMARTAG